MGIKVISVGGVIPIRDWIGSFQHSSPDLNFFEVGKPRKYWAFQRFPQFPFRCQWASVARRKPTNLAILAFYLKRCFI